MISAGTPASAASVAAGTMSVSDQGQASHGPVVVVGG
jgi:hypothetical protein